MGIAIKIVVGSVAASFILGPALGGNAFQGFCLLVIIGIYVVPFALAAYYAYRTWLWVAARTARADMPPATDSKPRAAVLRASGSPAQNALVQYIEDALRDGQEEGAVGDALLKKGWAQEQVEAAFSTYRETLEKYRKPARGLT
jgi:hypothetical protein